MPGATSAGRVVCPRCGANNFDTQAACWSCGAALRAGAPVAPNPSPAAASPARENRDTLPPATPYPVAPAATLDPAVAIWAAVALAILFPYVAVPVGIVFLMLDDRRKAEIGRVALIAGILLSLLHGLFYLWLTKVAWDEVRGFISGPSAAQIIDRAQQERQPRLNDALPQGFPTP